jgi:hypothetical protein
MDDKLEIERLLSLDEDDLYAELAPDSLGAGEGDLDPEEFGRRKIHDLLPKLRELLCNNIRFVAREPSNSIVDTSVLVAEILRESAGLPPVPVLTISVIVVRFLVYKLCPK